MNSIEKEHASGWRRMMPWAGLKLNPASLEFYVWIQSLLEALGCFSVPYKIWYTVHSGRVVLLRNSIPNLDMGMIKWSAISVFVSRQFLHIRKIQDISLSPSSWVSLHCQFNSTQRNCRPIEELSFVGVRYPLWLERCHISIATEIRYKLQKWRMSGDELNFVSALCCDITINQPYFHSQFSKSFFIEH